MDTLCEKSANEEENEVNSETIVISDSEKKTNSSEEKSRETSPESLEIEIEKNEKEIKNKENEKNLYKFIGYVKNELKDFVANDEDGKLRKYLLIIREMKQCFKEKPSTLKDLDDKNLLISKYSSENESMKAKNENLEKKCKTLEMRINDLEQETQNVKIHRDKIFEKVKQQHKEIAEQKDTVDQMNNYLRKLFKIYEINKDIELVDSLDLITSHENERKRITKAYKNLTAEKQELIEQNITLQELIGTKTNEIAKLRNSIDQHALNIISKEQEIIKIQRELEAAKFAKLVSQEVIHQFHLFSTKYNMVEASYKQIYKLYISKMKEVSDLVEFKNDLSVQKDLLLSLNKDFQQKHHQDVLNITFLTENLNQEIDTNYTTSKINSEIYQKYIQSLEKLKKLEEYSTKQSNFFSNKRYESIISDLKKEINQMKTSDDADEKQRQLHAEIHSLKDDIKILNSELREKNKLVDYLLKTDMNSYIEKDRIKSPFENMFYPSQNEKNLAIINESLKNSLEESIMKNLLLKENIQALGLEIERLNNKIANVE